MSTTETSKKISDNEWAAEFVGLKVVEVRVWYLDLHFRAAYMVNGERVYVRDWHPDTDLNQFRLVLGKYRDWFFNKPRKKTRGPSSVAWHAFLDNPKALKRIREAVEEGSA